MIQHESKLDFFNGTTFIGKISYIIGVGKLIPKMFSGGGKYKYGMKFRRIHPVTWLFLLFVILINGLNKEILKDIKNDTVWF